MHRRYDKTLLGGVHERRAGIKRRAILNRDRARVRELIFIYPRETSVDRDVLDSRRDKLPTLEREERNQWREKNVDADTHVYFARPRAKLFPFFVIVTFLRVSNTHICRSPYPSGALYSLDTRFIPIAKR